MEVHPAKKNSIDDINIDALSPVLLRSYTIDSNTIAVVFDEPVDSTTASFPAHYTIDHIGHPVSALPVMPACTEVVLKLPAPLHNNVVHTLTIKNITDCAGNSIGQYNTTKAGLPAPANQLDVVINEVLFNPPADGFDYIELYNRSRSIVDLKQLYLGNRHATGQLTNITSLHQDPYLLFPGEYKTFTTNKQWVQQQYLVKDPALIIQTTHLPSMPDDKSILVLMNHQGTVLDELQYSENWHFALIDNKEGVALERINYNATTQDKTNWTSAASTAGFGTPGYPNSQLQAAMQAQGQVTLAPAIFSPDNDGHDDFATIQYELPEPGYVTNISIFDAHGYRVRYLVQQATLSLTGQFRWDGLDDKSNRLPVGTYVVLTELFHVNGKTKKIKNAITLARR